MEFILSSFSNSRLSPSPCIKPIVSKLSTLALKSKYGSNDCLTSFVVGNRLLKNRFLLCTLEADQGTLASPQYGE